MNTTNYFSEVTPALLVATLDAFHLNPCRQKFPCINPKKGQEGIRSIIRNFWKLVPTAEQRETTDRLQLCYFALEAQYNFAFRDFLQRLRSGNLLWLVLEEQYEDWCAQRKRPRSPTRTLLRIVNAKPGLTLEMATYLLGALTVEVRQVLGMMLNRQLHRVCHYITFNAATHNPRLLIQFTAGGELEDRPILI